MGSYKVKSLIRRGERDKETGETTRTTYLPGDTIELDDNEAYDMRHALENPPLRPSKEPAVVTAARRKRTSGGDSLEEMAQSQEEVDEALDSIRRRPDNPDSGVPMPWKMSGPAMSPEPSATEPVGHGFERANAGASNVEKEQKIQKASMTGQPLKTTEAAGGQQSEPAKK